MTDTTPSLPLRLLLRLLGDRPGFGVHSDLLLHRVVSGMRRRGGVALPVLMGFGLACAVLGIQEERFLGNPFESLLGGRILLLHLLFIATLLAITLVATSIYKRHHPMMRDLSVTPINPRILPRILIGPGIGVVMIVLVVAVVVVVGVASAFPRTGQYLRRSAAFSFGLLAADTLVLTLWARVAYSTFRVALCHAAHRAVLWTHLPPSTILWKTVGFCTALFLLHWITFVLVVCFGWFLDPGFHPSHRFDVYSVITIELATASFLICWRQKKLHESIERTFVQDFLLLQWMSLEPSMRQISAERKRLWPVLELWDKYYAMCEAEMSGDRESIGASRVDFRSSLESLRETPPAAGLGYELLGLPLPPVDWDEITNQDAESPCRKPSTS